MNEPNELTARLDEIGDKRLRELWDEGVASGPGRYNDIEEIKAEARRRLLTYDHPGGHVPDTAA